MLMPAILAAGPYDGLVKELAGSGVSPKESVAVASFEAEDERIGRTVADEITEAFTRAGVQVVERKNLDRVHEELKLQLSGVVSDEAGAELGEAVGASYIVLGTVREIRKPGYSNVGLKIQARVVDVGDNTVIGSASTEVEKSDMTTPYQRRELRGAAEYPSLLDLRVGANLYHLYFTDEDVETDEPNGPGLELGISYSGRTTGFLASEWEFIYGWDRQKERSLELQSQRFTLGRSFLVRIPLWRYIQSLPYLTHTFFGINGASTLSYRYGDVDDFFGIHFKAAALAGAAYGLSDALHLFAEYRYNFKIFNIGWEGFGTEGGLDRYQLRGHQLFIGLSLAP
jgi:TolB-like protein